MATRTDFTDEEWAALEKGVMGSSLLVSLADRGFFETFKEVGALAKHLQEAQRSSTSPLIQELAHVRPAGCLHQPIGGFRVDCEQELRGGSLAGMREARRVDQRVDTLQMA